MGDRCRREFSLCRSPSLYASHSLRQVVVHLQVDLVPFEVLPLDQRLHSCLDQGGLGQEAGLQLISHLQSTTFMLGILSPRLIIAYLCHQVVVDELLPRLHHTDDGCLNLVLPVVVDLELALD